MEKTLCLNHSLYFWKESDYRSRWYSIRYVQNEQNQRCNIFPRVYIVRHPLRVTMQQCVMESFEPLYGICGSEWVTNQVFYLTHWRRVRHICVSKLNSIDSDNGVSSVRRQAIIWTNAATVYPKKYAHGFVVLCFVVVMQPFVMNSHEVFIHIHQGCFAGTVAIVRLPQCQWSKPDGYGKISQCITTTKHSKAKTVCIFLGITV